MENKIDDGGLEKIKEEIGIAIGEASMCWDEVPTGIFDASRAGKIVDRLFAMIAEKRRTGKNDSPS